MIKYLGSKRTLIPAILHAVRECIALSRHDRDAHNASDNRPAPHATVLDLFSGTSRVGHALKRAGYRVIANDHNAYARALAMCYVQADREDVLDEARRLVQEFNALASRTASPPDDSDAAPPPDGSDAASASEPALAPGSAPAAHGYFTRTFCIRSRFFHPANGARIDAVRRAIAAKHLDPELEAVMLVSLMEAADRVDSTTGVQMAYLKSWAARARKPLELRVPDVLPRAAAGKGEAHGLDAVQAARRFAQRFEADVAYLDPPYNQHSYLGNYHIWETLVRGDEPAVYGVACKREDCRTRPSGFNSKRAIGATLDELLRTVRARSLIVSFNNEGFIAREEMERKLATLGRVTTLAFDYKRYVGAQIGIYNPGGRKVGRISHLRNTEHLFIVTPAQAPPPRVPRSLVPPPGPQAETAAARSR